MGKVTERDIVSFAIEFAEKICEINSKIIFNKGYKYCIYFGDRRTHLYGIYDYVHSGCSADDILKAFCIPIGISVNEYTGDENCIAYLECKGVLYEKMYYYASMGAGGDEAQELCNAARTISDKYGMYFVWTGSGLIFYDINDVLDMNHKITAEDYICNERFIRREERQYALFLYNILRKYHDPDIRTEEITKIFEACSISPEAEIKHVFNEQASIRDFFERKFFSENNACCDETVKEIMNAAPDIAVFYAEKEESFLLFLECKFESAEAAYEKQQDIQWQAEDLFCKNYITDLKISPKTENGKKACVVRFVRNEPQGLCEIPISVCLSVSMRNFSLNKYMRLRNEGTPPRKITERDIAAFAVEITNRLWEIDEDMMDFEGDGYYLVWGDKKISLYDIYEDEYTADDVLKCCDAAERNAKELSGSDNCVLYFACEGDLYEKMYNYEGWGEGGHQAKELYYAMWYISEIYGMYFDWAGGALIFYDCYADDK